mgnify:CR=1 FL=1
MIHMSTDNKRRAAFGFWILGGQPPHHIPSRALLLEDIDTGLERGFGNLDAHHHLPLVESRLDLLEILSSRGNQFLSDLAAQRKSRDSRICHGSIVTQSDQFIPNLRIRARYEYNSLRPFLPRRHGLVTHA